MRGVYSKKRQAEYYGNQYESGLREKLPEVLNTDKVNLPERAELTTALLLWMMNNQLGRRNLNDFQRVEIVRKCEDAVKAQAERRMLKGKADPVPKSAQGRSRDELAQMAGVSRSTYEHAVELLSEI